MQQFGFRKFGRTYRRFRHDNQYDSPLLIFFLDFGISLFKLLLVVACLGGLWFGLTNFMVIR